jgi:predicted HAD superfamily phosphohydrolase
MSAGESNHEAGSTAGSIRGSGVEVGFAINEVCLESSPINEVEVAIAATAATAEPPMMNLRRETSLISNLLQVFSKPHGKCNNVDGWVSPTPS